MTCPHCHHTKLDILVQRVNTIVGQQIVYDCRRCGYLFVVRYQA